MKAACRGPKEDVKGPRQFSASPRAGPFETFCNSSTIHKARESRVSLPRHSYRHFNSSAVARRGLKAPSKENIRVACHPRMSSRASPTFALSIGVASIYMPPSTLSPLSVPPLGGISSGLFSFCLLKLTEDQLVTETKLQRQTVIEKFEGRGILLGDLSSYLGDFWMMFF